MMPWVTKINPMALRYTFFICLETVNTKRPIFNSSHIISSFIMVQYTPIMTFKYLQIAMARKHSLTLMMYVTT